MGGRGRHMGGIMTRYTELQISSDILDQPVFSGEPKKIFICSTPRTGSYLLCRYMINAGLGVPHVEASPLTRSSYHARDAAAAAGAHGQPVLLR